jgi:DNA-binding PucR family transcriptional regulator
LRPWVSWLSVSSAPSIMARYSLINAIKPRFEAILEPTTAVARRHPDLAETVLAYSGCRYSVSAFARQLHIHPNSARYRLDRWKALTGHDLETAHGLTASVIALELMS